MKKLPKTIGLARRLADRLLPLTLVIGFLISVGFPAAYYVLECGALQRTATIYTAHLAETFQGSTLETATLWKNQPQEYSQVPADWLPEELANIEGLAATGQAAGYDHKTQEMQAWGNRFVFKGPAAIAANRRQIGKAQVRMSHRQLLETTFVLLLVCTTIAASLAALIYYFPTKIVRGAEEQLQKMIEAVQASSSESDRLAGCAQASEQRFRNLVHGSTRSFGKVTLKPSRSPLSVNERKRFWVTRFKDGSQNQVSFSTSSIQRTVSSSKPCAGSLSKKGGTTVLNVG